MVNFFHIYTLMENNPNSMYQLPVVLSAFANSPDQAYLAQLKEEYKSLGRVFLTRTDLRHLNLSDTTREDLLDTLQKYPDTLQVLHFGGHADGGQLYLEDQAGQGQGLAQILETYPNIQLVFLNGCKTLDQAEVFLAMGVPAVIVTTCSVTDGQAMRFAKAFYTALANHQSLENAFKQASGAMEFQGVKATGENIVLYRGLELEKAEVQQSPPWQLHVQEAQASAIKGWTFSNPARLPHLINYYQGLKTKMPKGVRFLDQYFIEGTEAIKYKHYLSEGVLPYYSLDAFHLEKGYNEEQFSEARLLQTLLEGPHIEGGIISGKGGVGKTRMMLQMGLMAHEAGWNVVVLNERFEDEAELGAFLDGLERKKHLLLIDYIEECSWFNDNFIEEISSHCNQVEEVRFLGNCRNSFHYLSNETCIDIHLDEHPYKVEYEQWVVNLILQPFIGLLGGNKKHRTKPSFAVFLRHLQQRHPESASNLRNFKDFRSWLLKRFIHTVDPQRSTIDQFGTEIHWLLSFPLNHQQKMAYLETASPFKQALNRLIIDGWIEENDDRDLIQWRVIQDTVIDELLMAYLARFGDVQVELSNTFAYAYQVQRAHQWLQVLHRLKEEELFVKQTGLFSAVFKNRIVDEAPLEVGLDLQLWQSPLMSLEEKLTLSESLPLFFEVSISTFDFVKTLNGFLKKVRTIEQAQLVKLKVWVDRWIDRWLVNNRDLYKVKVGILVFNYIRVYGFGSIQDLLIQFINKNAEQRQIWFMLKIWLDSKGDMAIIEPYVIKYLQHNAKVREAWLVLKAWLDAQGDLKMVQPFVVEYLKKNAIDKNAQFVLKAWLDAQGDLILIQAFVIQHLENNIYKEEVSFILQAWLDANCDLKLVQSFVIEYLKKNAHDSNARFVLKSWLDADGDLQLVQFFAIEYLKHNFADPNAGFVLKAWLDAQGNLQLIQSFIIKHLESNILEEKISFILQPWLNAQGDLKMIQPFVIEYLKKNAPDPNARFVLKAWLDAGGDLQLVQPFVIEHLKHPVEDPNARFVLKAWLDADGDLQLVQPFVIEHLKHHVEDPNARFVLKAWLDAQGDLQLIQSFIIQHLESNIYNEDASFILQAWLEASGESALIYPFIIQYLENHAAVLSSNFLLSTWLEQKCDLTLAQSFVIEYLQVNCKKTGADFVLKAWLNAGGDLQVIQIFLLEYLQVHASKNEAQFIIKAWLDAKPSPDLELIKPFVIEYLRHNAHEKEASFVVQAWLSAKGELALIQPFAIIYLEKNAADVNAQFLLTAWLNAKGEPALVQSFLVIYLEKNAADVNAQFVLTAWLNARGELALIQPFAIIHLEKNAAYVNSMFLLTAWLNAKGDLTLVQSFVVIYLEKNVADVNAQFVLRAWLNAKGGLKSVQAFVVIYLEKNAADVNAQFVLTSWLNAKGDLNLVQAFVVIYLEKNAADVNAQFVLTAWLNAKGDLKLVETFVLLSLKKNINSLNTRFILTAWLNAHVELDLIKPFLIDYLEQNTTDKKHSILTYGLAQCQGRT